MKHEEQQKENSPRREQKEQSKSKDKQHECAAEHKSYLEQMVNTVREGFNEFNEVLANTIKGTNQPQQGNTNQVQNTPANHIQQLEAQTHQALPSPPMMYTQNFP